jgi:putative nucleotidyltransferase with HDIG domain
MAPWSHLPSPARSGAVDPRWLSLLLAAAVAAGLGLATLVTYTAGGTDTVAPQLYYLPIVFAGFRFRVPGGLVTGVVAGLLCGPLMPLDTAAGVSQETRSWVLRLLVFAAVGTATGFLVELSHRRESELERFGVQVSRAFVRAIDAGHPYTARHSETVAGYAVAIAEQLRLPAADVERIRWAALLHDVGKLGLPTSVLDKPLELTSLEWELVKRHPVESARIIEGVDLFRDQLDGVRHHHERYDGHGYPDGLHGEEIPLDARIIAVADAFDAMTTNRAYRLPVERLEAFARIARGAGTQFDPVVVSAFGEVLGATAEAGVQAPAREAAAGRSAA